MDCSTHKSIYAFTTCYPKIHLHTHSGMCRSHEWGLMRAGWPSHHCLHRFSCCILTVDSQECFTGHLPAACAYCRPLHHNKSKWGLGFQEALLSVLHLCPALPTGGSEQGLTERVQHINFSCIAELLFRTHTLLFTWPYPPPLFLSFHAPGGWARGLAMQPHPLTLRMLGRKYCTASEQQVLSLPIINYTCCITLGFLTPKLKIFISCTILFL